MEPIKIIAEIANAHQGEPDQLKQLVKEAQGAGADGVKFQWFKFDCLATQDYAYYSLYEKLFIPEDVWHQVLLLAQSLGMEIWVDVFDAWGLTMARTYRDFLHGIKIPPTIIQSRAIMKGVLELKKPLMIGVGGWTFEEIDDFLAQHQLREAQVPITLIHGFQGYPTRTEDANLIRLHALKNRYGLSVGFADHEDASRTIAIDLPVYAMFAGATLIEKHLTLDRSKQGHDYYSSLEPWEFARMVRKLRKVAVALGDLQIKETERNYLKDSLRVVAKEAIEKGGVITDAMVENKRTSHGGALMPQEFAERLPLVARETIEKDQAIYGEMVKPPKVVLAVVCRLKSTRLPKKALLPIYGVPTIERCLMNALAVKGVDQVVLAISDVAQDDPLESFTLEGRVKVMRGDPDNVVARLLMVAEATAADVLIRVTGDCPAISPEILELLLKEHLTRGGHMTIAKMDYPPGTAGDVYTVAGLKRLLSFGKSLTHTEYLSFYFLNNPEIFTVNQIQLPQEFCYPHWRLTVDEQADLDLFEEIYRNLDWGRKAMYFSKLRSYLLQHPEILQLNSHISLKWRDNQQLVKELEEATRLGEMK